MLKSDGNRNLKMNIDGASDIKFMYYKAFKFQKKIIHLFEIAIFKSLAEH
jgi:hypothetical protein